MTVEQNILSHILIGIEYIRKIICNNSILHYIIKHLVWYNHDTNPFSIKHIFGGFLDVPDVCADILFFWHQKIIITFLANEIHCSVEMALTLGKHRSPSSWIHLHLPNLTDAVFVAGAVQRGMLASEWEGTRIMATPVSTHLVGPSSRCSDWWRKTPGSTFTGRWAAHL